jgi:hypothetical protein
VAKHWRSQWHTDGANGTLAQPVAHGVGRNASMFRAGKAAPARPFSVVYPFSGDFVRCPYIGVDIDIVQIPASTYNPAAAK